MCLRCFLLAFKLYIALLLIFIYTILIKNVGFDEGVLENDFMLNKLKLSAAITQVFSVP